MSVFAIKLLAMAAMVTDHLGYWLFHEGLIDDNIYVLMRSVGRIAFPLFCLLIVNGWQHTRDRTKYVTRLTGFAVLSQIPFVLVFTPANYSAAISGAVSFTAPAMGYIALSLLAGFFWYRAVRADVTALLPVLALITGMCTLRLGNVYLLRPDMNVFHTLAFSLAIICVLDKFLRYKTLPPKDYMQAAALLAAFPVIWDRADYGLNGMLLIITLWLFRDSRPRQALMLLVWCAVCYPPGTANTGYFIGAALSVLPLYLYNGRHGKSLKTAFYLVYPLHLSVLGIISLL